MLAGIQVDVQRGPGLADDVAERVIIVPVGHRASGIRQQPDAAVAVIAVEAGPARLALADAVEAIGIDSLN